MAPRAYWKGYLKLSLVSCPVALFPATSEREKISFHQLNKSTGNRIKYRKVDAEDRSATNSGTRARTRARASLKSHRRWLAHCDSRRDRAANRLDHVTLTPGAAALALATDTLWVPFGPKASSTLSADGRRAQVVDVTLRRRFVPLSYAQIG
jgi:hypothetical protein